MSTEENNEKQASSLENFEWGEGSEWFGQKDDTAVMEPEAEVVAAEEKVETAEEKAQRERNEAVAAEEATMFADPEQPAGEPSEAVEPVSQEAVEEAEILDLTDYALDLRDRGILAFDDLEEGETIDADKLFSFTEQEIDKGIEEFTNGFIEALQADDDSAAFIRFKKAGGSTQEFFELYRTTAAIPSDIDVSSEQGQRAVAEYVIRNVEGGDDDDVKTRLEYLKDSGTLESFAAKNQGKLKQLKKEHEQNLVASQEKRLGELKQRRKESMKDITTTLKKTERLAGLEITQEDKRDMASYIVEPTIKRGKNLVPELHAAIGDILTGNDKEKLLKLAKVVRSDFDFGDVKTEAKKEHIKESRTAAKANARPHSRKAPRSSGGELADSF